VHDPPPWHHLVALVTAFVPTSRSVGFAVSFIGAIVLSGCGTVDLPGGERAGRGVGQAEAAVADGNFGTGRQTADASLTPAGPIDQAEENSVVTAVPANYDEAVPEGSIVYALRCSSCHGDLGEGGIGPPVIGLDPNLIKRQVRAPVGEMPLYTSDFLGPEELAVVVDYVTRLPPPGDGVLPEFNEAIPRPPEGQFLTRLEESRILHILLHRAVVANETVRAGELISHVRPLLAGAHLADIDDIEAWLTAGDHLSATAVLTDMTGDDPLAAMGDDEATLWILAQAAARGDSSAVTWLVSTLSTPDPGVEAGIRAEMMELAQTGQFDMLAANLGEILGPLPG